MASMRSLASSLAQLSVARPAAPAFARSASTAAAIAPPNYLSSLRSRPGHRLKAKRSGRGWGSSRPRGGRGDGGQKARTKVQIWMAGGGSHPLLKQVPKRPVIHTEANPPQILSIDKLLYYIRCGRIDPSRTITMKELHDSGCVTKLARSGVKLVASNSSESTSDPMPALSLLLPDATAQAIAAVEAAGGRIVCRYYSPLARRALIRPESFLAKGRVLPGPPDPTSRRDIERYLDPSLRGYLALRRLAQQQKGLALGEPVPSIATLLGQTRRRARTPAEAVDEAAAEKAASAAPMADGPAVDAMPGPSGLENPPARRAEEA